MEKHKQSAEISGHSQRGKTKSSTGKPQSKGQARVEEHSDDDYQEINTTMTKVKSPTVQKNRNSMLDHYDQNSTDLISNLEAETKQLRGQIQMIREHWQEDVDELERKDAKRQLDEVTLRAEIQHLKIARRERERAGIDDLETELFIKTQDTYHWQIQVQEMQSLKLFIDDNSPKPRPVEGKIIQKALDTIGIEVKSILHGSHAESMSQSPAIRRYGDLDLLLKDLFPEELDFFSRRKELEKQTAKWGLPMVVRGLTVAALRDWVFTSDFPNFSENGNPRILEEYRNIIMRFSGWNKLRNLEVAAYRALTVTSHFKDNLLPRRAGTLSERLSQTLAPLFLQSSDISVKERFASWGQDRNACESRRFRFKKIFETALELKVATVLTNERYEFALHPLGSINKPPVSNSNNVLPNTKADDLSKIWLHASFMTYNGRYSNPRDRTTDALVHTRNFHSEQERQFEELLTTHCLTVKEISKGVELSDVVPRNTANPSWEQVAGQSQTPSRLPSRQDEIDPTTPLNKAKSRKRRQSTFLDASDMLSTYEPSSKPRASKKKSKKENIPQMPDLDIQGAPDNMDVEDEEDEDDVDMAGSHSPSNRIRCYECKKAFPNQNQLISHQSQGCPKFKSCDRNFGNMQELRVHQSSASCMARRRAQDIPAEGSASKGNTSQQMHSSKKLTATSGICRGQSPEMSQHHDREEDSSADTRRRTQDHSVLGLAGFGPNSTQASSDHETKTNTSTDVRCPNCDTKFSSNGGLSNHKRRKTCRPCSKCDKWFTRSGMKKHIDIDHPKPDRIQVELEGNEVSSPTMLRSPSPESNGGRRASARSIEGAASDKDPEDEEVDAQREDSNEDFQSESPLHRRSARGQMPQDDKSKTEHEDEQSTIVTRKSTRKQIIRSQSLASSASDEEEPPNQRNTDEVMPNDSNISQRTRSGSSPCLPFGDADGIDNSNYVSGLVLGSQSSSQTSGKTSQVADLRHESGFKSRYFNDNAKEVGTKRLKLAELDRRQRSNQSPVHHSNRAAYGSEDLGDQALRASKETRWSEEKDMNGRNISLLDNPGAVLSDEPRSLVSLPRQIPGDNILSSGPPLRQSTLMHGMSTPQKPMDFASQYVVSHRNFQPLRAPMGSPIFRQETLYPSRDNQQRLNEDNSQYDDGYFPPSSQLNWTRDHIKEPVVNTSPALNLPSTNQMTSSQGKILPAVNTSPTFDIPKESQESSLDLLVLASNIESSRREGYDDERKVSPQAPSDIDAEYEIDNDEMNNSYPRNYPADTSDPVTFSSIRRTSPYQHQSYKDIQGDADAESELDDDTKSQGEEIVNMIPTEDTITIPGRDPHDNKSSSHYIDISSNEEAEGETDPDVEDKENPRMEARRSFGSGLPDIPGWFVKSFKGRSA